MGSAGSVGGMSVATNAAEVARRQLERILSSKPFLGAGRLSRFLRVIVEKTLAGEADLSEYTVAFDVFDRGPDFDPRTDPIVRVHARRLRARLKQYYETDGSQDEIEIELPLRTYTPVIRRRAVSRLRVPRRGNGAAIAVMPLVSLSADKEDEYFAEGLTQELIHALMGLGNLQIVALNGTFNGARESGLVAAISGRIRRFENRVRVSVQLVSTGAAVLWSEMYEGELANVLATQRDIAQSVSQQLARLIGV